MWLRRERYNDPELATVDMLIIPVAKLRAFYKSQACGQKKLKRIEWRMVKRLMNRMFIC